MWEGVFEYDPSLPSCLRRVEPIRLGKNYSIIRETNNLQLNLELLKSKS